METNLCKRCLKNDPTNSFGTCLTCKKKLCEECMFNCFFCITEIPQNRGTVICSCDACGIGRVVLGKDYTDEIRVFCERSKNPLEFLCKMKKLNDRMTLLPALKKRNPA